MCVGGGSSWLAKPTWIHSIELSAVGKSSRVWLPGTWKSSFGMPSISNQPTIKWLVAMIGASKKYTALRNILTCFKSKDNSLKKRERERAKERGILLTRGRRRKWMELGFVSKHQFRPIHQFHAEQVVPLQCLFIHYKSPRYENRHRNILACRYSSSGSRGTWNPSQELQCCT